MPSRPHRRARKGHARRRRVRRIGSATSALLSRAYRRLARTVRRSISALAGAPPAVRVVAIVLVIVAVWAAVNAVYQAVRKPSELFFPVGDALAKTPDETWRTYGPLFREHSTAFITPALLAALAQVEGSGNPVARTYWRWRPARNPFNVYQPASSAVGMYQITDATFEEARRLCIHDHVVADQGCWFNFLYSRVVPSHAIEMTSALLDRQVASAVAHSGIAVASATPARRQDLAAAIHLCGPSVGDAFAARGFHPSAGQRCGDHDLDGYLARVNAMKRQFARMATSG